MIISAVRTTSPGFLRSRPRMNVMLTRCEAGMVIVTNRRFVEVGARDTLLGQLVDHWQHKGAQDLWTHSSLVANRTANMPGVPASRSVERQQQPKAESLRRRDAETFRVPSSPTFISKRSRSPDAFDPHIVPVERHVLRSHRSRDASDSSRHWSPPQKPTTRSSSFRRSPSRHVSWKENSSYSPSPPPKRRHL